MSGATKTTLATAINSVFRPVMVKTFDESTPIVDFFGTVPSLGGDSIDWKINYAGSDSAETFSEGDAAPAASYQSYVDATLGHNHFQNTVQISGHAKDALKNGYFDGAIKEIQGGVSALGHLVETTIMADIVDAIDDDTTYAGLTRATYGLASFVQAGGSVALTVEMLENCWEAMLLDGRTVDMSDFLWFCSPEQDMAYQRAADGLGGINLNLEMGSQLDVGRAQSSRSFNGKPIVVFSTLTNTYVFGTKKSDILIEEARPLTIEALGKTDDTDKFLITWAGKGAHLDPLRACRIEALAT